MSASTNLILPYIEAAQAQKHITHNEAIRALDALVQLAVADRTRTVPPASPSDGDRHIVGPSATGAWAGNDGRIAAWQDGVWTFYEPRNGWLCWVAGEAALLARQNGAWVEVEGTGGSGGGGGGGGGDTTAIERDIRLLALRQADLLGDRLNMVDGIADSFDDFTDVDTGGSTNLDTGTAGRIRPTSGGGDEDGGYTESGTENLSAYTLVDRGWSVDNSETVTIIWVKSASAITFTVKIVKRNSAGNYDVVVSESFSHSGTGWEAKTLASPYAVPASGEYYVAIYYASGSVAKSASAHARAYKSGDITGTGQTGFAEDSYATPLLRVTYAGTINNMDARSNAFTADSAPDTGRIHLHVGGADIGSITINTDLKAHLSRDGGTTWTQATLAKVGELADGTCLYEDASADISGQPSGTSLKWRIETANNKDLEVTGVLEQWA